jgi:hypothetical protein
VRDRGREVQREGERESFGVNSSLPEDELRACKSL